MAQEVKVTETVIRRDDISGKVFHEGEIITFSLDGEDYEIELNKRNAETMRRAFGKYIQHATPARSMAASSRRSVFEVARIRKWAHANGYRLSERGRLPEHVVDAYRQATGN